MHIQYVVFRYEVLPDGGQMNHIVDVIDTTYEDWRAGKLQRRYDELSLLYNYRLQYIVFSRPFSFSEQAQQVNANVPQTVQKPPVRFDSQVYFPDPVPDLSYTPHRLPSQAEAIDQAENEQEPEKASEPYRHPSDWE